MIDFGLGQGELSLGDVITEADSRRVLEGIVDIGGSRVRIGVWWDRVEAKRGQFKWSGLDRAVNLSTEYGLKPLLCTVVGSNLFRFPNMPAWSSPTSYGDFVKALAQRYAELVGEFELWNEANNVGFFPDALKPAVYTDYLKAGYTAIKSVHPDSTVLTTGLMPIGSGWASLDPITFATRMYDAGAQGHFDGLGYHWYSTDRNFNYVPPTPTSPWWVQLTKIRELMVKRGDGDKKIWITEMGFKHPTLDLVTARDYLKTQVEMVLAEDYFAPFYIYNYRNSGTDMSNKHNQFGMVDFHFNKKQPLWDYVATIRGEESTVTEEQYSDLLARLTALDAKLDAIASVTSDTQVQMRGPDLRGWNQLGQNDQGQDLTMVDAIAALRSDVNRLAD